MFLIATIISCKTNNDRSDKLTYIFNSYKTTGNKEYLDVKVFGDRVQRDLLVLVEDWGKLEGIRRTKGVGYRGSELRGLEIKVVSDPIAKYSYKDLKSIID
ncbi:hypothetical protein HQN86_01495 [Pedobacter panaciterrae]|uniref:hypothetical protein n=1 Tax=Pedobacter panaciterrae TaxID=363849 RepID=UPI00155DA8EF|nr:hypothetical protein [Pedobacter panaciterrae]NQX52278.1 hypothetical protein [Pedobacter panaciterrae]